MPSPEECAYAAGIIDGEGSIFVTARISNDEKIGHTTHRRAQVWVKVSSTTPTLLTWMNERWPGSVRVYYPKKSTHKPQGTWDVAARKAEAFLTDIRPYLVIKAAQADNALAVRVLQTQRRRNPVNPMTWAEWGKFQAFVDRSHELNKGSAFPKKDV